MRRLALIVEYETRAGEEAAFETKIRAHAKACLAEEPGCLRFEVLRPLDDHGKPHSNLFMANELFTDEAALEAHRATPRWHRMSEVFKELLVRRKPVLSEMEIEDN
jgi:(4S)-4-hydroxy-5-phosphonooxypentane-2,3-dione isomerase